MPSLFENGIQGLADNKWSGPKGSVAKIVGIDYRSKPGILTAHQKLTKNSGATVDELCKVPLDVSDGSTLWFSSTSGKIWREVDGVWTLVYTINPITDFDQYAAFAEAYPSYAANTATIWQTFNTTPVINFSSGIVLNPSGTDAPKVSARELNRAPSAATTISQTITIPDRPNQVVIAIAGCYDLIQPSISPTGITYDGGAMTSVGSGSGTSGGFKVGWGISRYVNPVAGSHTIEATFGYSVEDRFLYVICFEGVNQTTPIGDTDSGFGNNSPALAYLNLLGTANNQLLVMATFAQESVISPDPGSFGIINANADLTPPDFYESISGKVLRIGNPIVLGAAEFKGSSNTVIDGFTPANNEPDLSEEVNMVYFATSDILWKIPVDDLASWTGNVTTVGVFQNGNDTYHPMTIQNLQLFIGDGNLIAKVNELNQFIAETELNVEKQEVITVLIGYDIDILIGTKDTRQCRIIRWDTVSESWSAEDEIDDTEIYAFIKDDNFIYALVGDWGQLYYYDGEKLNTFMRIPGTYTPSSRAKIHANAVGFLGGIPVFGLSNLEGNPTEQGVYGLGAYSKDYKKTLSLDYPISADAFENVEIGGIITRGYVMMVSWKSGSTYGVDKLDYTAKYASAYLETVLLSPPANRANFKTIARIQAPYASLPSNTAVAFSYKKNYAGSYTALTSVVDALQYKIKAEKSIPKIGNIQLKLALTVSGNTAPEVEDFMLDWVSESTRTP